MTLAIRPIHPHEADAVARMVHDLARDVGVPFKPKLTGDALRKALDLVDVVVAEEGGQLLGACLGLMTYSTWRAARGLYVVDLFVSSAARNRKLGALLLRAAGARARTRGASFIKLEVDHANDGAARFYERFGFQKHEEDQLFVLEEDRLIEFLKI